MRVWKDGLTNFLDGVLIIVADPVNIDSNDAQVDLIAASSPVSSIFQKQRREVRHVLAASML